MPTANTQPVVVLAERNRHVRDFLRREFERAGYLVRAFGLGRDAALAALTEGEALVLDRESADADLAGVIRWMCERRPRLPVVVRAHSAEEAGECLVSGQVLFVAKEQDPAGLLEAVGQALEGARKAP